jgi:uncharacterized OsmC-like protein
MNGEFCVTLTREDNYRFVLDFGSGMAKTVSDEPEPVGEDTGPNPEQLLAAAVANCLAASLLFAVRKFKGDPGHLSATAICKTGRNEKNRLRVTGLDVAITLDAEPESLPHLERALAQFEDFCTVSQSVRSGIPFTVSVKSPDGRVLK